MPSWNRPTPSRRWLSCILCSLVACSFPGHEFTDSRGNAGGDANAGGAGASDAGMGGLGNADNGGQSTSSRAGSTSHITEICDNRVDDNGDGRVDCADADCVAANWVCLPAVPAEWVGPIAMASASPAAQLPTCEDSGGYREAVASTWCSRVSTRTAHCPACPQCSPVESPSKSVTLTLNTECSGNCITSTTAECRPKLAEGCQRVQLSQSSLLSTAILPQLSIKVDAPVVSGGTCQSASSKIVADALDKECVEPMLVCRGPAMGSCPFAGTGCMLKPRSPFATRPCIYSIGAKSSCPTGWELSRVVAYSNVVDTRGCSDCTCSPPGPSAYGDIAAIVTDYALDETCQATFGKASAGKYGCFGGLQAEFDSSGFATRYLKVSITSPTPSCMQAGGQAIGSVETQAPVTICCATQ